MEIFFILVEPAVGGNIGAAARAIKTMGFNKLRLVNPCDHLSLESKMFAHASHEILENAELFPGLAEALVGIDLSIATTAKQKDARLTYHKNSELPGIIRGKGKLIRSVGLVFGREESGLTKAEIRLCDLAGTIPLKQSYPSLNLAQAVMIFAYTLALADSKETQNGPFPGRDTKVKPENNNEFRIMMARTGQVLRKLELDHSPALYNRILERMALLREEDIHLVLSFLSRLE